PPPPSTLLPYTTLFRSGRNPRRFAVHFCAVDGVQPALHLVRYGVRVPRREEDDGRGSSGARGRIGGPPRGTKSHGSGGAAGGIDGRRAAAARGDLPAGGESAGGRLHGDHRDERGTIYRADAEG